MAELLPTFRIHRVGSTLHMLSTWHQRKQEESYLGQLEQLLVQRIRVDDDPQPLTSDLVRGEDLSEFSREINEELGRIESLVKDFDAD
jgi:hypothetical protein